MSDDTLMQAILKMIITAEVLFLILVWAGTGCVSNKPLPCDWYCPKGGRVPEDCFCRGDVLEELRRQQ